MLTRLSINNYALIQQLSVDFSKGLNTLTGETGAGKSIILGALGLILGSRADLSVLKNKSEKCVVEGLFEIGNYNLKSFFEANDLDYDIQTIFRREIASSGKSRAFINDTPVNLKILKELGLKLIDIHSQHQNLELSNHNFQLNLVDLVAGTGALLKQYYLQYNNFILLKKNLVEIKAKSEKAATDLDYFQFQFNQLEEANLQENEQEGLEKELEKLVHSEEIKAVFVKIQQLLDNEQFSVVQNIKESVSELNKIEDFVTQVPELAERLQSSMFEIKDIVEEAQMLAEKIEYNPAKIEKLNNRLNEIYGLQQKHHVSSVKELIELKKSFDEKINTVTAYESEIERCKKLLAEQRNELAVMAQKLTRQRLKAFPKIEKSVLNDLRLLGMPKSKFTLEHNLLDGFSPNGSDFVSILFTANADLDPDEISRIASGGEMSRLMLAVKNLLRNSKALPTVVFDEIDSGVSGEIAVKMGRIIESFSESTQIINITHLPQIAAKGKAHFKVFKYEKNGKTLTSIKKLSENERIEELAKMVGGENFTQSNIQSANELLKN